MALKEYPSIQVKVVSVIKKLLEDKIGDLERRHLENPWMERMDLNRLINDLEKLMVNVEKFHEGGYTVFVYNVLLGVLEGVREVLDWLNEWIGSLESDFDLYIDDEE
jgi:hypothetical protein